MTANELRKKYIDFFKKKGHKEIPGASLIPENDPTVLFTTAGMHPLVPYLLGEKHPAGKRLVNIQKCVRTGDIDEVGDACHLTFFEMLGNWSLGDPDAPDGVGAGYFKKEAIEMSWEFLTSKKWLKIPKDKLAVSVFGGDPEMNSGQAAPRDEEAASVWLAVGMPKERIAYLGKEDNWWGPAGKIGPCGPDTEMFYWTGEGDAPTKFDPKDKRWVEIWNDVFMEYYKDESGKFQKAKQKNVDTGMGLERTLAVLNGYKNIYEIDEFQKIIDSLCENAGIPKKEKENFVISNEKPIRIIADHLRAAIFIVAAGVLPSNKERGYILRRLIRRLKVKYSVNLNIAGSMRDFIDKTCKIVKKFHSDIYPELKNPEISDMIVSEIEKFQKTLAAGMKQYEKLKEIDGRAAFDLYQSYGFPIELTEELASARGFKINRDKFYEEFEKHQELSRTASVGMFKGGLADASEISKKYHTATHLLHAALRKVLGGEVAQKGSNITAERLRFDFSYGGKMTPEQIRQVEDLVNGQIKKDLTVKMEEMPVEEAKKSGALGLFEHKYGERVKVYTIGDFSKEICGGPHVLSTGELGYFKIVKEEAVAAGTRRIKAILE